MTTRQRAQLYHEFGKLIGAGMHVDRSVEVLLDQHPAAPIRAWLEGLRRGLAEHLSVADAVKQHTKATPLEVSLLAAGERGGQIESACAHLARYYELRQKSRDKAIGAVIYPMVLLHFGLVLPEIPRIILGESGLGTIALHVLTAWLIMAGLALAAWGCMKVAATSAVVDDLLNSIPLFGGARRHWALARFCQVFQTGLLAAFRISESLHLAGEASQSARLREAAQTAASAAEAGEPLTPAMKRTQAFPRSFIQSVATSEETGTLDTEMGRWAGTEAELAAQAQDRLAEWLPKLFYFIIVFYVAARIIDMAMGIYGPNSPAMKMLDSI